MTTLIDEIPFDTPAPLSPSDPRFIAGLEDTANLACKLGLTWSDYWACYGHQVRQARVCDVDAYRGLLGRLWRIFWGERL
jgi:hypothetical protein